MRIICLLFLICCAMAVGAQNTLIIPEPVKTSVNKGSFTISNKTTIVLTDDGEQHSANFLNAYLKEVYGFSFPVQKQAKGNYIRLTTRKFVQAPENEGRYTLQVA